MSFNHGSLLAFGLCVALAAATTTTTTVTATTTTTTTSTGFLAPTTTTTTTTTTASTVRLVATEFVKYFDVDTEFNVSGSVYFGQVIAESGVPGQSLTWDLEDVDPACKTGSGNQCGIHIHAGTSCSENAEGDFWNETLVSSDPWTAVQYDTISGSSLQTQGVRVISGLEGDEIVGHAVIVYDSQAPGRRIACALIKETDAPTTTTTTTTTTPPSSSIGWIAIGIVAGVIVAGVSATACFLWAICIRHESETETEQ